MKWAILILFGSVGAGALWFGLSWGAERYALVNSGVEAAGVIVAHVEHKREGSTAKIYDDGGSTTYHPLVEFETARGEVIRIEGTTGNSDRAKSDVGTAVTVIYDPAKPANAVITEFQQAWLGPLALSVFGFVFLLFAVGGFVAIGRSDAQSAPAFEAAQREMERMREELRRQQP